MSNFQQRDMSGVLFKNDKGDNQSRPDYRGEIVIEGKTYELSSWIKDGQKGKFMSIAAKPKEERQAAPAQRTAQRPPPPRQSGGGSGFDDMDSDVPF